MSNSIPIQNIYYMLSYAYKSLQVAEEQQFGAEAFANIYDMFAEIIASELSIILKRGLYRSYVDVNDDLNTVRGKINIKESINNSLRGCKRLNCSFDKFNENNIYNQIVKTTIIYLLKQNGISKVRIVLLRKLLIYLDGIDEISPKNIPWTGLYFAKENMYYRYIITVCYFILDGMIMNSSESEYKLNNYIDEQKMHSLYEKFILEYYRKHFPMLRPDPIIIKWNLDNDNTAFLPRMKTDITLRYEDKALIIDAKYYSNMMQSHFDNYSIHSNNLYQIFTYVKNYDSTRSGKVSGMLLYAKTNESVVPNQSYMMSENNIFVRTLDLNTSFDSISKTLDSIVYTIFDIKKIV